MQRDVLGRRAGRQVAQQRSHIVFEHLARPAEAGLGQRDAVRVAQPLEGDEVVIAGYAAYGEIDHPSDALVG